MAMRKLAKSVQELAKCWLVVIQGAMPTSSMRSIEPSKSRGWKKRWPGFDLLIHAIHTALPPSQTFCFDKSRYREGIGSFAIEPLLTTPLTPYLTFLA